MMSVLMKLTGGSPKLAPLLNVNAFLKQARAYDAAVDDFSTLWKTLQTAQLTHPLPVIRARAIDQWANSNSYRAILQGS
jgi:Zn-dependent protease with chaperone function